MAQILNRPIHRLANLRFRCDCGKDHRVDIQKIIVGQGILARIPELIRRTSTDSPESPPQVCLIADGNTWRAAGEAAAEVLAAAGIPAHPLLFPGDHRLTPDEAALGHILGGIRPTDDFLLTVGSGTLNDLTRFVSARTGIPYAIVATAPSMDGYASTVSPLILGGKKTTLSGVYPTGILADIQVLKEAPMEMLTAGFGDILGKLVSDADWRLAAALQGEARCETCAALVSRAVDHCVTNAPALPARSAETVGLITEALILSGVAMGLFGNSRPASGAEHHFSHYWEVDALKRNQAHPLHGNSVGVGAVLAASLYRLAAPLLPEGFQAPDPAQLRDILKAAGAPSTPQELGISKDLFHDSILNAMHARERYTILRFCHAQHQLENFGTQLTETFYSGG